MRSNNDSGTIRWSYPNRQGMFGKIATLDFESDETISAIEIVGLREFSSIRLVITQEYRE